MRILLLSMFVALVLCVGALAARPLPDPRVCALYATHTAQLCARDAARVALKVYAEKRTRADWNVMLTCTGNQAWLRWRCTFRNATGHGSAVVAFSSVTFEPSVTMNLICTPQAPLAGASPPVALHGCNSTVPAQ